MSYEDWRQAPWQQWDPEAAELPVAQRSRSPGKRTLTMGLLSRPESAPTSARAPVQQKADPGAVARRAQQTALSAQWMDAAIRPDLHQAPVQRKSTGDPSVHGSTGVAAGSGQPLPGDVQAKMENAFGADFSEVRIHEGPQATAMGALAYTQGTDIHFAPSHYNPDSQRGQELLGHELSHVVQQSQGRVQAPTQAKGAPINDDAALEREADDMGARAAQGQSVRALRPATGQGPGGVVQRYQQPGAAAAQCPAFQPVAVPSVVDVGRILDPVQRNHAINQSYNAFDTSMTQYLGSPLVSNWCTYGQHASREAGSQIANLQAAMDTLADVRAILLSLPSSANPVTIIRSATRAVQAIRRVLTLLNQPGMVQQAIQLAMTKADITQQDLQDVVDASEEVLTFEWSDLIPFVQQAEQVQLAIEVLEVAAKLVSAIPAIISSLQLIHSNMIQGNRQIYENIAPAYHLFLTTANGAPEGVPGPLSFAGDTNGFLTAAFEEYANVRSLTNELDCMAPDAPERPAKIEERNQKAHRANLLIGFQEQLVILQPIFDTMQEELQAMSGTMVLHDPNGVRALAPNWGDFYTRMGIDPATAPADPMSITPDNLPPTLSSSDPRNAGTINEYFTEGLTDERIHQAPPPIERM